MSGSSNIAEDISGDSEISEPSMEEILASIKQIIADDEAAQDDGLTERERYTHPGEHSNSNRPEAGVAVNAQTAASVDDVLMETEVTTDQQSAAAPVVAPPKPTTLEQRLEEYRQRDRLRMQKLAEQSGFGPSVPPVRVPTRRIDGSDSGAPPTVQVASEYVARELDVTAVVESLARDMFAKHEAEIERKLMEAMAPVVRKWLGDNLPTLVDRLVRQEIEQISRQSRE